MADKRDNLIDWLRDAHAMEQQAEQMLSAQKSRLENYPKLRTRIEKHLEETQGQKALLEQTLARLGKEPSTLKDIGGKLMAFGQAVGGMAVSDEVIKGAMAGYVFENVEIAAYTVLIAAAKAAGDVETQKACEQILPQEIAMAEWLKEHLPELTQAFLDRSETPGLEAKR
ncbi:MULTISPECIES: ferritin-like domain-containing protein [unclassified Pseudomonas]|jgi:ferritin-like metal-binding protein YciE|uniref:ferritin-like domain-containing protein n=1 Tax=unclassified Pseudomonas TaxID=196821 RepID=UPI0010F9557C|nr:MULTISPECIES: ferritin-like domain-containing protein [unclassified Pseudomonas]WJN61759.1 Protein YciE [Pseudomonas sp. SO81]